MLRAIQDPLVADATASCDIDYEWLCDPNQANTLTSVAAQRSEAPRDALRGMSATCSTASLRALLPHGPLKNPLLVVMDEAANTPCTWLAPRLVDLFRIGVLL